MNTSIIKSETMASLTYLFFQTILTFAFFGSNFNSTDTNNQYFIQGLNIDNDYVVFLSPIEQSNTLQSIFVIQETSMEEIPKQKMYVENRGNKIVLRSAKNCYILEVDNTEIEGAHPCDNPINIKGIGLSTHRIHKKIHVDDFISSIENDIFSALSDGPGIKIDKCNICASGGPGASQCDYSGDVATIGVSCSVTCREGYYACCHVSCYCCLEPNSFDIAPDDK